MPGASTFASAAPYHVLRYESLLLDTNHSDAESYGTLLGTEIFQSFIGGITAFRVLPRSQFATLQSALFPIYFSMQTAFPVALALTFPAQHTANGTIPCGIWGVFDATNRVHVLTPLATVFLAGLVNAVYVGPATTKVMRERKHQETRDGKRSHDPPPHSSEMQALNRRFGQLHGVSSLVNLVGILATVWYGFHLAGRMS